jgi:hypothetical protein
MTTKEITELRGAIARMRQHVETLRARHGEIPAVQRLANDIDRLSIDTAEVAELDAMPRQRVSAAGGHDVVVLHDTPYDDSLWREADDEGLGGRRDR